MAYGFWVQVSKLYSTTLSGSSSKCVKDCASHIPSVRVRKNSQTLWQIWRTTTIRGEKGLPKGKVFKGDNCGVVGDALRGETIHTH